MSVLGNAAALLTAEGDRLPIKGNWSAGRSKGNSLVLAHEKVSRRHALIHLQGEGEFWLVDLGSSNGTFLNGKRIHHPVVLRDQDRIDIAHFRLTFLQTSVDPESAGDAPSTDVTAPDIRTVPCWLLVADIESFTRLSQTLPPDQLPIVTGRWLSQCKEVIEKGDGAINKFLGDGFFAYWRDTSGFSERLTATLAALEKLQSEAQPKFRIVLHHGDVSVGGASASGEESLLGKEVNFAFRMEKLAGSLSLPRLLSESANARLSPLRPTREVGRYPLSGFDGQFTFYTC